MQWLISFLALITIVLVAVHQGYRRTRAGKKPRDGWFGLAFILICTWGIFLAGESGNESLAYTFGFILMAGIPLLLAVAIISSVINAVFRRSTNNKK